MAVAEMCATQEYELPLDDGEQQDEVEPRSSAALPEKFLIRNARWFCTLRWVVVSVLALYWVVTAPLGLTTILGLREDTRWSITVASILALGNLAFIAHIHWLTRVRASDHAALSLWSQIAFDVLVLTAVVHCVGSLDTCIPFAYVFHITLACIFFSQTQSLWVTALACVLYATCVALEETGLLPARSIYLDTALRSSVRGAPKLMTINVASTIGVYMVVWYLVSRLSAMVRERDHELARTNHRLVQMQEEKARHMLRTTHQLKAPFAAIHANAQLLLKGHCGVMSDDALEVVTRISQRCRRLASEIQEMLQLANLRSPTEAEQAPQELDVAGSLKWCIGQVRQVADEHEIAIEEDIQPALTIGVEDHLKMLLVNLLANAVTYSHDGGAVEVQCACGSNGEPLVTIQDHGIGISGEKLPRIFDEYYRTNDAVQHNRESTGLGLAIVRYAAHALGAQLRVASAPSVGTRFTLRFPTFTRALLPENAAKGDDRWAIS